MPKSPMPTVRDVLAALEEIAPAHLAFPWDKIGIQVGRADAPVHTAVVSLDRSMSAIGFAKDVGAQLLLSHHPLIFTPLETATSETEEGESILALAVAGLNFVAAHTNWDAAKGGINDALAERLGLESVATFGSGAAEKMLCVEVHCPAQSADAVIDAMSAAGAGRIGEYERCAFFSSGIGTFILGDIANPALGERGKMARIDETRIQMQVPEPARGAVETAIRTAHPYEEPAYQFLSTGSKPCLASGRLCRLDRPVRLRELVELVDDRLETSSLAWGDPDLQIATLGIVGGAADGEWALARAAGADAFLTGEIKQHVGVSIARANYAALASGHYATENPGCAALTVRMQAALPTIEWIHFEPTRGFGGRPFSANW